MMYKENQSVFNQIKGKVIEINKGELYFDLTIEVGHANIRNVNLSSKNDYYERLLNGIAINDMVVAEFYASSNKKHERWYTTLTLLSIRKQ